MNISVIGRHLNVREDTKALIEKKLAKFDRFFPDGADASVTCKSEGDEKRMEITISVNGTLFRAEESSDTFQNALDGCMSSIERQIRNVKERYPDAVIVTDEYTGTKLDRPGWMNLYKKVKSGDVIVFDSVSRMSRDAEEGFQVYEELFRRGVELIFLKEPQINTETYKKAMDGQIQLAIKSGNVAADELIGGIAEAINKYLLALAKEQIRLAFDQAEKEVEDLHQRTREGIETARLAGKQIGQVKGAKLTTKKSIKAKEIIMKRSKDFHGDLSDAEVMTLTGLARGTYYKYKRELKNNNT